MRLIDSNVSLAKANLSVSCLLQTLMADSSLQSLMLVGGTMPLIPLSVASMFCLRLELREEAMVFVIMVSDCIDVSSSFTSSMCCMTSDLAFFFFEPLALFGSDVWGVEDIK